MFQQYDLDTLQNLNSSSVAYEDIIQTNGNMRNEAIRRVAEQLGMQAGLAHESKIINNRLQRHAQQLYKVFNFNQLLYNNYLLPPVIVQSSNQVRVSDDGSTIRAGGHTYEIIKQVQFVSVPPTWENYLKMNYAAPRLPDKSVLPKTPQEQNIWAQYTVKGWSEGIQQGINIFNINMHKLSRDFNGMVLYKQLLAKRMVSPFYVESKNLGITGNSQHMTVDDHTLKITTKPQLQINKSGNLWKAVSVKNEANK